MTACGADDKVTPCFFEAISYLVAAPPVAVVPERADDVCHGVLIQHSAFSFMTGLGSTERCSERTVRPFRELALFTSAHADLSELRFARESDWASPSSALVRNA